MGRGVVPQGSELCLETNLLHDFIRPLFLKIILTPGSFKGGRRGGVKGGGAKEGAKEGNKVCHNS